MTPSARRRASWPWTFTATRCAACGARPGWRSATSSTSASPRRDRPPHGDHLLRGGRHGDRAGRGRVAREDRQAVARSVCRAAAVRDPPDGLRGPGARAPVARPRRRAGHAAGGADAEAVLGRGVARRADLRDHPLVLTLDGRFIAADGKLEVDENAHKPARRSPPRSWPGTPRATTGAPARIRTRSRHGSAA